MYQYQKNVHVVRICLIPNAGQMNVRMNAQKKSDLYGGDFMLQFIVGIVIGVFLTLLCIGVWAVLEEDKENKK